LRDFAKRVSLSIKASLLYICARTLTLFFVSWKSQCRTIPFKSREKPMTIHKTISRLSIFALAIGLMSLSGQPGYAQEHHTVNLSNVRGLPYSDGIVAGNTLYIAGQEGADDSDKLVAGGIAAETKAALENVQRVIKAAGFDLKDIVSVTVYLADIHEFGDMNQVYKNFLPDPKPARATIQAAALVNNARIEISAIAVRQK
jgi:2-iminobutanoate/2-iminopropanoate deaminase